MSDAENMVRTTPAARLISGMVSGNPAIVASTELELVKLCEAGCANAQRGCLCLLYGLWREGHLNYPDFSWRMAEIFRIAVTTDTIRKLFVYEGDDTPEPDGSPMLWESEDGQLAEYICILDMMADAGDPAGMIALGKISDVVPAEILELGRCLRFLPPDRPCGVGAHDLFADLTSPTVAMPPPLERFDWDAVSAPLTRSERVRWWFADRWWGARFRFDDMCWSARLAWWRVSDAVKLWLEGY